MAVTMTSSGHELDSKRRAWVTLLTLPSYVPAVLTMWRTLQPLTIYPLIILTTSSLPQSSRDILKRYDLESLEIDHLSPPSHKGFEAKFARFTETWTKLRAFGLEQFEKLVMIDSDVLFLRSMDEIFDIDLPEGWVGAAPACVCNPFKIPYYPKDWIPENCAINRQSRYATPSDIPIPDPDGPWRVHQLNSGVVLFAPSKQHAETLEKFIQESPIVPTLTFPDQETLCHVYKGKWKPLPWWCNALKTERAVHQDQWADKEVRMIHYILDKPWSARPKMVDEILPRLPLTPVSALNSPVLAPKWSSLPLDLMAFLPETPAQKGVTEYDEVHTWWWLAYEEVLSEMKSAGDASGWREVEKYVTR
ncbi:galactinol synthase [Kockovaella imperatae]|uniref:Galactinol synthase n=1 Tax=Kockovaella imperatae TaxID=4999 RepID=A0A1Y1ULZ0_9TREE|nr:galactinol synthase [Kockovaella imperatae]ORX39078.1 galactinol synthase [Kockovaella imperatae]